MNAPMKSRYPESYRRSMADPEGFWAEAAARDRLDDARPTRCSTPTPASTAAGSSAPSATPATTPSTATSSAAAASRRRSSTTARSPARSARITYARAAGRGGDARRRCCRSSASARATASSSTCRWCPRRSSRMLACARIGAIHSVVFGGFAATELATRIDDAKPKVILSASCGIEPAPGRRLQAAARRGDRRSPATSRQACLDLPAAAGRGRR